ncbi:PQQ-binding-like beta-propeller repeat protein [Dactylosporangium sp. NPDC050688]|uniref:outer membrane protein assembly factor BamB family protein n=1 Tax=Dactylosporangium sp. NPDC050688 TaxID=3157217 RepID=UPI0033E4D472
MDQPLEIVWSRSLCIRSSATTVAASDVLIVAERHSRLVRLDPGTGTLMWEQRVEDCWGTTAVAQGRCLYLSQRGVLHCFDLQSGRPMWSTPNLEIHRYLSISGSVVVLGGWRGYHPVT